MHAIRIAAAACLALTLPAGLELVGAATTSASPAAEITIATDDADWTRRVDWALEQMRGAGLELPSMTVEVHEDNVACDGNAGLFQPTSPPEVHLCPRRSPDSRASKLITLHELAHAWAETQLTAQERSAFLALRGLDAWVDEDAPPHEWGAEHAAEVVSWGLMDEEVSIIRIYDAEPDQLLPAFQLLVNQTPSWMHAERF